LGEGGERKIGKPVARRRGGNRAGLTAQPMIKQKSESKKKKKTVCLKREKKNRNGVRETRVARAINEKNPRAGGGETYGT